MSKRITLDNLKTFLTQLKTHITDPIANDVSTLTTKVRNAENNIITANSNISSVQNALNDKADKNHNHNYLSLSGGTMTGEITLPNRKAIKSKNTNGSSTNLIQMIENSAYVGDGNLTDIIILATTTSQVTVWNGKNEWYKVYHSGNINDNKFATMVNVKNYINNSDLFTFVDDEHTQYKFTKSGLYKITVTKANNQASGISFCDTSLDFETKGNVLVGYNVGLYEPVSSSLVMYIDKTKIYEFFGFETGEYHGATSYTKYRGAEFKTKLQGSNILIELIKEC